MDEMVNGQGGIRPHWRDLLSAVGGDGQLGERARRLDRAFEDEGLATLLPGAKRDRIAWRCDPMPLPLPAAEFADLEAGLAQRATLLQAILSDLYGAQSLLAEGALPPGFVYANPGFLRPCRDMPPRLHLYAADLLRNADGQWAVLSDRTAIASGLGYARENRRLLGQVIPEAFRAAPLRSLRPFFDLWQDTLQRLAPGAPADPAVAVLSPGTAHPQWFEHMMLSRELSCALVECGDLTVRQGGVFLKTLAGLQPVHVLLSRLDGQALDPLEFPGADAASGVAGLLDAARQGSVAIVNAPGTALVEAPGLAAFLPALAQRLLGAPLLLPQAETHWLGDPDAAAAVQADLPSWLIRPALDGTAHADVPADLDLADRAALATRIEAAPAGFAATRLPQPSVAPSVEAGKLVPKPVMLRLFLVFDGNRWHCMPGGLARVLEPGERLTGRLPQQGLCKDVWVLAEDNSDIIGPGPQSLPPIAIRRTAGALPSRAADNLFWLGRYVERLERSTRLVRATNARLTRGVRLPRELAELQALGRCLLQARLATPEDLPGSATAATLPQALQRSARPGGAVAQLQDQVARLTEIVRDRLTADMYAAFTLTLRAARQAAQELDGSAEALSRAMVLNLRFANAIAGVAAENMVRGGGWLFLELGRRIERAQAVAAEVSLALDQPPARIEGGLRLILELCDSVITYRSRYVTVLQPAPVLDLVLADPSNPRGLAFQLEAMQAALRQVAGGQDDMVQLAAGLRREAEQLVQRVLAARDQAVEATLAAPELKAMADTLAAMSDALTRRYFALLPAAQALGIDTDGVAEPVA